MGAISVLDHPQAVFPDGQQPALALVNNGPFTVYLDSDSSISAANSQPLPPTATTVWEDGRALWVLGAGPATLIYNRNAYLVDASRAATNTLISDTSFPSVTNLHNVLMFECSAYNSLIVIGQSLDLPATAMGNVVTFTFYWYDDAGTLLLKESMRMWTNDDDEFTFTVPVKGASCEIQTESDGANSFFYSFDFIKVYGTSRVLRETFSHRIAPIVSPTGGVGPQHARGMCISTAWDFAPLFIPSWGNQLNIAINCPTPNVTVAGSLQVRDADVNSIGYGQMTIPVANFGTITEKTFWVPTSRGIILNGTAPTGPNSARVTMTWSDYNGG